MSGQSPRWEWRSFGSRFGTAERRFATLTGSPVQISEEVYLLSDTGGNVKIRDGLLDIKELQCISSDGLEQWSPVLKAAFPVDSAAINGIRAALGSSVVLPSKDQLSLDDLLSALRAQAAIVRVVEVKKRRVRYTVQGCMAELSEVEADGHHTRTIAVESIDADAVLRGVEWLGLSGFVNTSYPKGLASLTGGNPEAWAVIDVGTNSVKLHIGTRDAAGQWRTMADRAEVTRLGEGIAETGRIGLAPLERTAAAIRGMVDEARRSGAGAIIAVGTAGLRQASNGAETVKAIREQTGVAIEVISGEEEARLAYLAATLDLGDKAGTSVVFDTGGGSSQFTFGHGSIVDERFSLNVGAARYVQGYGLDGPVDAGRLSAALKGISDDLSQLDNRASPDVLIGMGGAITNMTAVRLGLTTYDPEKVQGAVLDRAEIERQIDMYRRMNAAERRTIPGLQPSRAEVILAGACIVKTVMEKLDCQQLVVSDRGLRHGVLRDRCG